MRAAERGAVAPVGLLEPENLAVLRTVLAALDTRERDWAAYHSATVAFHLRKVLAFQNCHRVAAFAPAAVDSAVYREFVSPRGQVLNQAPELRDR